MWILLSDKYEIMLGETIIIIVLNKNSVKLTFKDEKPNYWPQMNNIKERYFHEPC